jgi:RNA polymerase sigma-70 factor (sigma-E family)
MFDLKVSLLGACAPSVCAVGILLTTGLGGRRGHAHGRLDQIVPPVLPPNVWRRPSTRAWGHQVSDDDSFEAYVRARLPALNRTAFLLTGGNPHDAEDLVQAALARVVVRWRSVDDPDAYVRRALYHESVSRWRQLRARPAELLTAQPPERGASTDPDTRLVVAAALRRLTARQRAVLVLRFYEDRTEVQAAEILGVGIGTVKSQTRHALQRLRQVAPDLLKVHL